MQRLMISIVVPRMDSEGGMSGRQAHGEAVSIAQPVADAGSAGDRPAIGSRGGVEEGMVAREKEGDNRVPHRYREGAK